VCCDSLHAIGDRIRSVALGALIECGTSDCRQREFRSYVTLGSIVDPHGESLIVTMLSAEIAFLSRQGGVPSNPVTRSVWRVELLENGWPQAKANERDRIEIPNWAAIHAAAAHVYSHGSMMWHALVDAASRRSELTAMMFRPSTNPHIIQGNISVSSLRPLGPDAYQAGFWCQVTVDASFAAPPPVGS
jgi:hypothetical protein